MRMRSLRNRSLRNLLLACLVANSLTLASADDAKHKAVRMKTSRQLKEILTELEVPFVSSIQKDDLRELAYTENAVERWEELHPEKKPRRSRAPAGGGDDPLGGMDPGAVPDGMDPKEWARLMAQMRGDFSDEEDPEKRRILGKLKAKGMSFGGGNDMDIEQLRNMEKMMDGMGGMMGGGGGMMGGGMGGAGGSVGSDEPEDEIDEKEL